MVALRSLEADGYLIHSLQQDGLLVEAGLCADGSPAVLLSVRTDPGGAIARAERAIEKRQGPELGADRQNSYDRPTACTFCACMTVSDRALRCRRSTCLV